MDSRIYRDHQGRFASGPTSTGRLIADAADRCTKCDQCEIRLRQINPLVYPVARKSILQRANGWIVLCRAATVEGELICEETNSTYSHAGIIGWCEPNSLMLVESIQHADQVGPSGVRIVPLSTTVAEWPGYFDLFEPVWPGYDPNRAWSFALHASGTRYGWAFIHRVFWRRHLGTIVPPLPNSDDPRVRRDCSGFVHAAMRAGHGPQERAFDCDVLPGDFAGKPLRYKYHGTLFANEHAVGDVRPKRQSQPASVLNASGHYTPGRHIGNRFGGGDCEANHVGD